MPQAARPLLTQATRSHFNTLLDSRSLSHDSDPAIIYIETESDPITISRAEFSQQVASYAGVLHHLGIRQRELVVIAHTQNLESIYSFWACLMLGAIPSMFPTLTEKLDPDYYMTMLSGVVRHAGAQAILTTDDFAPLMADVVECPVFGSTALHANSVVSAPAYNVDPNEIAFLQHSSG